MSTVTSSSDAIFSEAKLNGLVLRNRLIAAAAFEGKTPGGHVTPELVAQHVAYGEGGIAMTTIGYCSAEADGRLHPDMLFMGEPARAELSAMIDAIHATGACVSGQLGHGGGFSKNHALSTPRPLGPSFGLNRLGAPYGMPFVDGMSTSQIAERVRVFARAATFMKSVGFDAIEIHFGHGYALSQFLSPLTNRRTDRYGGTTLGRMRFPLEVLAAVRAAVGDDFPLLGKISMSDGVRGGLELDESVEIAATLDREGLDCVVCSDGTSSMNPMLLFRGDSLQPGLVQNEKSAFARGVLRAIGPFFFERYPYEETYLLERALRVRERVRGAVCYVGGVASGAALERVVRAGFDFAQVGRALIYDPAFVRNVERDRAYVSGCTHCNRCAASIESEGGVRCPLRPTDGARADVA